MGYSLGESRDFGLFVVLDNGRETGALAAEGVAFSDDCKVVGGVFYGGLFHGGEFHGGVFWGGEFRGGEFWGGEFWGGWLPIQIQGSRHFVNCPDGENIQIGCKCETPRWWAENYKAVGKMEGYSDDQIDEYKRYIDLVSAMIEASKTDVYGIPKGGAA